MRYCDFRLVEGYREVTQKFAQEADIQNVTKAIDMYKDLVNRNQVQGNERNIDWWGKQGWEKFRTFVNAKSQQQSQTQQKKSKKVGKSYTLDETNEWLIVVPLDKDASCFHGKGSDWCTTKPQHDYFEQYFRDINVTLIYFLQKKTGNKWAIAVYKDGTDEYFDINDQKIGNGDLARQTGIPFDTIMKYVKMVSNKETDVSKKTDAARSRMKQDIIDLKNLIADHKDSGNKERSPEIETLLLKTKDQQSLVKYLHIIANKKSIKIDFDQNMQNLIALKSPESIINIANLTKKTTRLFMKHNTSSIVSLSIDDIDLALTIVKNNLDLIPHPKHAYDYVNLDEQLQMVFVKHNPLWILGFKETDDLSPKIEQHEDRILSSYFKDNPQTYGIIIEPGLTDLNWLDELTKEEYQKAVDYYSEYYGEESFSIINRDLKKLPDNVDVPNSSMVWD